MSVLCKVDKYTEIDLVKCPHILIGGSTGSGKSYLMKNMLCDILKSGDAMVMVLDPKSVDYKFLENDRKLEWDDDGKESNMIKDLWLSRGIWLGDRDSIDSFEALSELKELVKEMYRRYGIMKKLGYVDWQEVLNNNVKYSGPFGSKRIVLIVDELADLIYWDRQKTMEKLVGYSEGEELEISIGDTSGRGTEGTETQTVPILDGIWEDVSDDWNKRGGLMLRGNIEACLVKLSILGRAAGIHLILGTQRPDASVLSGQLRANLSCRICLRVSNKMERRIILGDSGQGNEREMKYLSMDYKLDYNLR